MHKLTPGQRRLRYARSKLAGAALVATVVLVLILADRSGVFGRARKQDFKKYDGLSFRVVKAIDGDTIKLAVPDRRKKTTTVRLWGVDTPETKKPGTPIQHFGPEAAAFTAAATEGKTVRLELYPLDTRDRYGRLLAYVYLPDGRMLNRVLVKEGYGLADPRFDHKYKSEFARRQREAIKAGRGLWKDVSPSDLPYHSRNVKLPKR